MLSRIDSLCAIRGVLTSTSTPYRRLSLAIVTLRCSSLIPRSSVAWLSSSCPQSSAGSSSTSLWSAVDSRTSSLRSRVEIVIAALRGGRAIKLAEISLCACRPRSIPGLALSALAIAIISPPWAWLSLVVLSPCIENSAPARTASPLPAISSLPSSSPSPSTRASASRPTAPPLAILKMRALAPLRPIR